MEFARAANGSVFYLGYGERAGGTLCTIRAQCLQPICSHFSQYIHFFSILHAISILIFIMSSICIKPSQFFSIFKILCIFVFKFPYKYW